jgi:hypothetical protein
MPARAVAAVSASKAKALDMFNKGARGFKDRDLYVLCADATDGVITASPTSNGRRLTDFPPGKEVMRTASKGNVSEIAYRWPRPGSIRCAPAEADAPEPTVALHVSSASGWKWQHPLRCQVPLGLDHK